MVSDFSEGTDLLRLDGGATFADLTFRGRDVLLGGAVIATLAGVDATALTADHFSL